MTATGTEKIAFVSGGVAQKELRLEGVSGREGLSTLFEYQLLFTRDNKEPFTVDEVDALLAAPCALALGRQMGDVVHGLLADIEYVDGENPNAHRYRARMVPTAWLLTQSRANRIFQDIDVPTLVAKVLSAYGLASGKDFQILASDPSPKREYVVQYKESDWDFIQRWLEHEGFFYWFEHGDAAERLMISNTNADATRIQSPSKVGYRSRNNLGTSGATTVWGLRRRQQRVPARVGVFDYNYRRPLTDLVVKREVDAKRGFGSVMYWGEHFKDNDEGKATAKVRAERFLATQRTFVGETDSARFRVGHTFELENHPDAELDGDYLITGIRSRIGVPPESVGGGAPNEWQTRRIEFDAIRADVQFRPERVTPWPKIDGVMHAHIEADGPGDTAQIDDQGRYKVRLPFDGGSAKGSRASRWIRMAQSYAGAGYGAHFPLHKGTEVLLAHIDGDPDRPIIVGSVPNASTVSPSTSSNATQSVIQTHSGIRIELEDRQA